MRRSILYAAALLGLASTAGAQSIVDGVAVEGVKMERNGQYLAVDMDMDLSALQVDRNRAVLLQPRLVNGTDSMDLPAIGVYGRQRYYFYVRNGESMITGKDEASYRASQKPEHILYNKVIPYEEWMNGSELSLLRRDYGCCHTLLAEQAGALGDYAEAVVFFPELVYVRPQGEISKERALEGSAFIDFPVNRTEIHPDYRRNQVELAKIQATIDSVRNDRDITITQVWLKGFASPESPYTHNNNLAIGRTEALKEYIQRLYRFNSGLIVTDHEAEDWQGLRRYVENSNLEHRTEILALIDRDMDPDSKEAKLKTTYPAEYRFLLQNCYPALRHTDYRIAYTIRNYSDVAEIKRILQEQPQKLSLNEFYLAAQDYEPGTDAFTEVFETAVRMFPNDEKANLNAASAAIRRDDFVAARRYLAKAGNSPEAVYAHGALAIREKDFDSARKYLNQAKSMGLQQAEVTLTELERKLSKAKK